MPKAIDVPIDPTLQPLKILRMIANGEGCSMFGDGNCGVDGCSCADELATLALYLMGFEVRNNIGLDAASLRVAAQELHDMNLAMPLLPRMR